MRGFKTTITKDEEGWWRSSDTGGEEEEEILPQIQKHGTQKELYLCRRSLVVVELVDVLLHVHNLHLLGLKRSFLSNKMRLANLIHVHRKKEREREKEREQRASENKYLFLLWTKNGICLRIKQTMASHNLIRQHDGDCLLTTLTKFSKSPR